MSSFIVQAIPRRARKVKIDSRFQSMFTDKKFKVKCMLASLVYDCVLDTIIINFRCCGS